MPWTADDGYAHLRRTSRKLSDVISTPAVTTKWCNIFGGEDVARSGADAVRNLGGLGAQPGEVASAGGNVKMWFCDRKSEGRFIMKCEHGHRSRNFMELCKPHYMQYRDKVEFCPACNKGCGVCEAAALVPWEPTTPHQCPNHRCKLRILHISAGKRD